MTKIFRIDMYPHDWLLDTSRLEPADRGNYIQILMLIYAKGGAIENDPKWISGSCGCSSRMVSASILRLFQMGFITISDEKISQKRAEKELNFKRTHLENSANGARVSNENKSQSSKNSDIGRGDTKNPLSAPTPTPTPTPISKSEEIDIESIPSARSYKIAFDFDMLTFTGIEPEKMAFWKEAYPAVEIEREIKGASAWLIANPKNRKSNYEKFLTNWFSKRQDKAPATGGLLNFDRNRPVDSAEDSFQRMKAKGLL